jgi:hypothetical protein
MAGPEAHVRRVGEQLFGAHDRVVDGPRVVEVDRLLAGMAGAGVAAVEEGQGEGGIEHVLTPSPGDHVEVPVRGASSARRRRDGGAPGGRGGVRAGLSVLVPLVSGPRPRRLRPLTLLRELVFRMAGPNS